MIIVERLSICLRENLDSRTVIEREVIYESFFEKIRSFVLRKCATPGYIAGVFSLDVWLQ